ncbi:adenylate/guanylate cyclase domain-containing protein [Stratiformator vulcanicus]|uniref:Adenylate cyclase 1 n=1 Tax=Stratiformator vulcanicus TaxID=2527980 RepID=A0A517QX05_9PLAN|nr:adenylate/guanylate cyclase domain-containing protein [Stratiformator vulcanicus]QDT36195.1 Adenylate cyclase 1 [Stratiformator vulcanicus]
MASSTPYLKNEATGHVFELNRDRFVIGRQTTNVDLSIPTDRDISRVHAVLTRENRVWTIRDQKSLNGVYVNDRKVEESQLRSRDVVRLGGTTLLFEDPNSTVAQQGKVFFESSGRLAVNDTDMSASLSLNARSYARALGGGDSHAELADDPSSILNSIALSSSDRLKQSTTVDLLQLYVQSFGELGKALITATDLDEFFECVLNLLFMFCPAERAAFFLLDAEGQLQPCVFRGLGTDNDEIDLSRTVIRDVIEKNQAVLIGNVEEEAEVAVSILRQKLSSLICAPMYRDGRTVGLCYADTKTSGDAFERNHLEYLLSLSLYAAVAMNMFEARARVKEERRKRRRLEGYLPPAVMEQVLEEQNVGQMSSKRADVTVMFADLSGFTAMSSNMEPHQVVSVLNTLYEHLIEAIFEHGGTLDKFMGDGLLAYFGAPLAQPDHAERAVAAGIDMMLAIDGLKVPDAPEVTLRIRVGVNSGPVVYGDIGTPKARNFTVIGDTVNVASRLESKVARPGQIVVSPATRTLLGDKFRFEELEETRLKGIAEPVRPFRICDNRLDDLLQRTVGPRH